MSLFTRATRAGLLNNMDRGKGCVAYDPTVAPSFDYIPSLAPGIVFSVFFALSLIAHILQTSISRRWWFSTFAIGALGELMGWIARAVGHKCVYNKTVFTLQISILIISPCFFSAGIYYVLGELLKRFGRHYSPISPRSYLIIFISLDLLSIIIQGVGGGLASAASSKTPKGNTTPGTHIMIAGIIIQLASTCVFAILWVAALYRVRSIYSHGRQGARPFFILVAATTFSTFCIIVRNFYRAVELGQGWHGYLISHEVYFCVLDGMLMALAVGIFNIFHPARLLSQIPKIADNDDGNDVMSHEIKPAETNGSPTV